MTFGFAPPPSDSSAQHTAAQPGRVLEPSEWADTGIPLLHNPRTVVTDLHERHRPVDATAVVAVFGPDERLVASASFTERPAAPDGWALRNGLLVHLRRIVPHDLRRRTPIRTAVLLYCRAGEPRWTETDGAWMWGLRDACTLHGLRCGAYIVLTPDGWQVLGEQRGGRRPRLAPHAENGSGTTEPSPAERHGAHAVRAPAVGQVPRARHGGTAAEASGRELRGAERQSVTEPDERPAPPRRAATG